MILLWNIKKSTQYKIISNFSLHKEQSPMVIQMILIELLLTVLLLCVLNEILNDHTQFVLMHFWTTEQKWLIINQTDVIITV